MRKITISASVLMALGSVQVMQAETIVLEFSKITADDVDPSTSILKEPKTINGFTLGNGSKCTVNKIGTANASFTIGGRTNGEGRSIKYTPKKNGTLIYNVSNAKDASHYSVVASRCFDHNQKADNMDAVVSNELLSNKQNKTIEVELKAGVTYWIIASEAQIFYSMKFVEAETVVPSASKTETLTIAKDKNSASTTIKGLAKGVYKFTAPEGYSIEATIANGPATAALTQEATVQVTENGTDVKVTVTADANVKEATDVKVKYEIEGTDLEKAKEAYRNKVARMINKTNAYSDDTRLQENALEASALMATVQSIGMDEYTEFMETGKIQSLEEAINTLSQTIADNAAVYDGYIYAQGEYAKLATVKGALDTAYEKVEDEAAKAAVKVTYDNAVKAYADLGAEIENDYNSAVNKDLAQYKKDIDNDVKGVIETITKATEAIEKGDGNAISFANVVIAIGEAEKAYNEEASSLYTLLVGGEDKAVYEDMYIEALAELNANLRVINSVKADNETKYQAGECNGDTQKAFEDALKAIDNGAILNKYTTKATALRANYVAACGAVKALTTDLKSRIEEAIGDRQRVKDAFASAIEGIKEDIAALQGNVDVANENHIIAAGNEYCENFTKDAEAITNKITDLLGDADAAEGANVAKAVAEYDALQAALGLIEAQQTAFNEVKDVVIAKESTDKAYNQATKFAVEYENKIQGMLNALKDAANASFKADGTGTARQFNANADVVEEDVVTLAGTASIATAILGYSDASEAAMTKYNEISDALAQYDLALNGKDAVGEEGKEGYVAAVPGLTDIATDLEVTIDGTVNGKSYSTKIAEYNKQIGDLKDKLAEAVALNDTAHVEAMAKIEAIADLVVDINAMAAAYNDNATAFNKAQLEAARNSMLAEATRRVGLIDTESVVANESYKDDYNTVVNTENPNTNKYEFEVATYGKLVSDTEKTEGDKTVTVKGLNTLLDECKTAVANISTEINNSKNAGDDADGIALLSKINSEMLPAAEKLFTDLGAMAESVKTEYAAEKATRKALLEEIVKKGGINEELAKVTFGESNMFADEVTAINATLEEIKAAINQSFDAETLRKDNAEGAYTKKLTAESAKITTLKGLVEKEAANVKANEDFTKSVTDAKIDELIGKVDFQITIGDNKQTLDKTDEMRQHFEGVKATISADYAKILEEQQNAFDAKTKVLADDKTPVAGTLDQVKYTDVNKNMVANKAQLEGRLATVKSALEELPTQIQTAYDAKVAQDKVAKDNDALREEVFATITNTETSSYHKEALAILLDTDSKIVAYKDLVKANYANGLSAVNATDIESAGADIFSTLKSLKDGWNDEYTKSVQEDNRQRYEAFTYALSDLKKTYTEKVDLVTKLSKLSYADDLGVANEIVNPTTGIYSFAEQIRALSNETDILYSKTIAPALFDAAGEQEKVAKELEAKVKEQAKIYSDAVNAKAQQLYVSELQKANQAYDDAKVEIVSVLGITVEEAAKALKDVKDIIDNANGKQDQENFALLLENEIIKSFNGIDGKIAADKEAAAVTVYTEAINSARDIEEAETAAIKAFQNEEGFAGTYSDAYAEFVKESLDAAEKEWEKLTTSEKYLKYAVVKTALEKFVVNDRKDYQDTEGEPAEYANAHSQIYWQAFDADRVFRANDIAYEKMQKYVAQAKDSLNKAEEFASVLLVRNHVFTEGATIANIEARVEAFHLANTAKDNEEAIKTACKQSIERTCTTEIATIIAEEKTAIEKQLGYLKHDYNQATAANIEDASLDEYKKLISEWNDENEKIYKNFNEGEVDEYGLPVLNENNERVKASAEETQVAYIALEKKIGKAKAELTAKYNENAAAEAKAAVDAEIDNLTDTYNALVAQMAECHAPVTKKYQEQIDAFKAEIDALQDILDSNVEDNTVALYKDVNVASAGIIAMSVDGLADNISNDEKPYDVNDEVYASQNDKLKVLSNTLENIKQETVEYEHKKTATIVPFKSDIVFDDEGNGKEFATQREMWLAEFEYQIEQLKSVIDEKNSKYELVAADDVEYTDLKNKMDNRAVRMAKYNVDMTMPTSPIDLDLTNGSYAPADMEALKTLKAELEAQIQAAKTFNTNIYGLNETKDEVVPATSTVDINGNAIEDAEAQTFMYDEQYATLITKAQDLRDAVAGLKVDAEAKKWIKGDADHNGKITVADYDAVRQMVLGKIEYQEGDANFYAADVNEDGLVNIGDVTQIGAFIMEGTEFVKATKAAALTRAQFAQVPSYGSLSMTAEGAGLEQTVKVAVDTELGFVGGQFDVLLPAGVTVAAVNSDSHEALMNDANGVVRVLVSNIENTEMQSGVAFVELSLEVSSEYNGGGIAVENAQFADAEGVVYSLAKSSISTPTGLTNLTVSEKMQSKIYSVGGMLMNKMKKGINIIVNSDGSIRKEVKE